MTRPSSVTMSFSNISESAAGTIDCGVSAVHTATRRARQALRISTTDNAVESRRYLSRRRGTNTAVKVTKPVGIVHRQCAQGISPIARNSLTGFMTHLGHRKLDSWPRPSCRIHGAVNQLNALLLTEPVHAAPSRALRPHGSWHSGHPLREIRLDLAKPCR